jgi:YegS/Rv2252/BmrU family lipid kinase
MSLLVPIISNPAARRSSLKKVWQAAEYLQQQGFDTELLFTEESGHAEALAREAVKKRPHRIIAAGGDGTINEVMNGMVFSDVPLAVLPLGTSNVLAKELNIPTDVQGAIQAALSGAVRRISLGKIELSGNSLGTPRYFCLMAGIGFDAKAVYDVNSAIKRISGEGAYVLSGIKTLISYAPAELFFTVDNREYSGYAAIIGKASRYGGHFMVTPDANIFEPSFSICIFTGRSRADLLRYAAGVIRGTHLKLHDVIYLKASNIEVIGNAHIQIDGEYLGTTPARISVEKDALQIVY